MMKEFSVIMKKDDNCPEELVNSVVKCLKETLYYSNNHHHLQQMNQLRKLRVLSAMIQKNLGAIEGFKLESWLTEVGCSFYFVCISYYSSNPPRLHSTPLRLHLRLEMKNRVTSLRENCVEAVGPYMRSLTNSEILELELPRGLRDQLVEYKKNDRKYYHSESKLKFYPHHIEKRKPGSKNNLSYHGPQNGDLMSIIWNKLRSFFSILWNIFM